VEYVYEFLVDLFKNQSSTRKILKEWKNDTKQSGLQLPVSGFTIATVLFRVMRIFLL
jgi:hypothetical protein